MTKTQCEIPGCESVATTRVGWPNQTVAMCGLHLSAFRYYENYNFDYNINIASPYGGLGMVSRDRIIELTQTAIRCGYHR